MLLLIRVCNRTGLHKLPPSIIHTGKQLCSKSSHPTSAAAECVRDFFRTVGVTSYHGNGSARTGTTSQDSAAIATLLDFRSKAQILAFKRMK